MTTRSTQMSLHGNSKQAVSTYILFRWLIVIQAVLPYCRLNGLFSLQRTILELQRHDKSPGSPTTLDFSKVAHCPSGSSTDFAASLQPSGCAPYHHTPTEMSTYAASLQPSGCAPYHHTSTEMSTYELQHATEGTVQTDAIKLQRLSSRVYMFVTAAHAIRGGD